MRGPAHADPATARPARRGLLQRVRRRFTGWVGGLPVGRKLLLIYLLDLTAVIYVTSLLLHEKFEAIDFTRKETVGLAYADAVRSRLLQPFGVVAAGAAEPLDTVRARHDEALRTATAADRFADALRAASDPRRGGGQAAQTAVVHSGRDLLTLVANQSNLILDPDLDSYYAMSLVMLRFPEALAVLDEAVDALAPVRDAPEEAARTRLLVLAGRIEGASRALRSDFAQASAASPAPVAQRLQAPAVRLLEELDALQVRVRQLAAGAANASGRAWQANTFRALDRAWSVAAAELDGLLDARVQRLYARMALHLGTAALLLTGILALVYLVARQIAQPLRRLARVANDVREQGERAQRLEWRSDDEIGQLVRAFNGMLDQLGHDRRVQQELAASARAARAEQALVESVPIAMLVTAIPDHRVLHANQPARPWLSGTGTDPWAAGLEPGVRGRFFQRLADHGAVDEFEVRWLGGDGPSWAVLSARRVRFLDQDAVITTFTPINVLKVMERRLELWAKVFEASSESILIMDAEQAILSVNRAFCRSTHYDHYEVIGEHLPTLLDVGDGAAWSQQLKDAVAHRDAWAGEVRIRRRSGDSYPAWLMVSAVREGPRDGGADAAKAADEGGERPVSHYIGISVDITDRKRTEARVQFLAEHDVLTELPNRAISLRRLGEAMAAADRSGGQAAVLFIDLDRFKAINDTLGHPVGDGLLRSVAARLQLAVRKGDTVARQGGDEFVMVLAHVEGRESVEELVAQRLIPSIRQPHQVDEHTLLVSCSVGIALYPQDGRSIDELMRRADAAMYEAKAAGRDTARFFQPEIDAMAQRRQTLERYLRKALDADGLAVHYQPRIDARTERMLGSEALVRWTDPELGSVPPAQFIPVAEDSGLIRPLGRFVLQQAAAQTAAWRGTPLEGMGVSVNLSAAQLGDPELVEQLAEVLQATGCDPAQIELEITESQLMESAGAAEERLAALKALGVRLSIDDFGTGYSSLAYLRRFPIDKLKIDRGFVRGLVADPANQAIVRAVIALGHSLNLAVVAEGVETPEEAQQLRQMGCDELQGYWFARPMPADALPRWLDEHQKRTGRRGAAAEAPSRR